MNEKELRENQRRFNRNFEWAYRSIVSDKENPKEIIDLLRSNIISVIEMMNRERDERLKEKISEESENLGYIDGMIPLHILLYLIDNHA